MNIDELSPADIGEERIILSVAASTPPRVGFVVQVDVNYEDCLPEGASLPLDFIVQGPGILGHAEKVYRERLPPQVSFIPEQAGPHLILLREQTHNRWHGKLRIDVVGDLVEA